ncbi:MAG: hypothetical protein LBG60_03965 [Bifidobacteriaceae bacterium]|jgi:hypothetical protein|nr:hypothetical protein [Bifidobacteriaceae bacterium]
MPQVSLYLDQGVLEAAAARAEEQGVPLSRWVSAALRRDLDSAWPAGFADLFGAVEDPSFLPPADLDWSDDAPRSEL